MTMVELETRVYRLDKEVNFIGNVDIEDFGEIELEVVAIIKGRVEIDANSNSIKDNSDL
jgi:hypothetical protein